MSNKPEWMLAYFRTKVEDVLAEKPEADAIEELSRMLTHYALMPAEAAKEEVRENDDE